MDRDDQAIFDDAHAKLEALVGHPSVEAVVLRFLKGALTVAQFLESLLQVPEIQAVLGGVGAGALAAIPGVGVFAAPLVPFALKAIAWMVGKPKTA